MSERQNNQSSCPAAGGRLAAAPTASDDDVLGEVELRDSTIPPNEAGTRLKVVSVAPGATSFSNTELPNGQPRLPRHDPYLGATVDGRYKVEALLGEGGMGVVYRCTHTIIGKTVAMKVLRSDLARDGEITERFLNEAKAASAIGNPHIIDISDFGQFPDGSTYFIMEFLGGFPLSKLLDGGDCVPLPRILHIARQLAEGLSAAHAAGIVHRDLKPDNIFLQDRAGQKDFAKILDFGIAKVSTRAEGRLTRVGAVFGTPHYMSPEQAAGVAVDERGDVYSLGVILYEMATGGVPFDADNFMGILSQHIYKTPVPLRSRTKESAALPEGLDAIVLKSLSKRPADRYRTMSDLIVDLDRLRDGQCPNAVQEMKARSGGFDASRSFFARKSTRPSTRGAARSSPRSTRAVLLLLGVAALTFLSTLLVNFVTDRENPPPVEAPRVVVVRESASSAQPVLETPAPRAHQVVLAVEPSDAHVFRGSEDLGTSPVVVVVPEGERVTLEIRREGFRAASWTADGTTSRKTIKLKRAGRAATASGPRAQASTNASASKRNVGVGSAEIVNPWEK